jgi:hypothetical protein
VRRTTDRASRSSTTCCSKSGNKPRTIGASFARANPGRPTIADLPEPSRAASAYGPPKRASSRGLHAPAGRAHRGSSRASRRRDGCRARRFERTARPPRRASPAWRRSYNRRRVELLARHSSVEAGGRLPTAVPPTVATGETVRARSLGQRPSTETPTALRLRGFFVAG